MNSEVPAQLRPVVKTIEIGTAKTGVDLRQKLIDSHYRLTDRASELLTGPDFVVSSRKNTVSLSDMFIPDVPAIPGLAYQDTYKKVKEVYSVPGRVYQDIIAKLLSEPSMRLCEAEDGPQLRLQYPEQPCFDHLLMAMQPILGSDGQLYAFVVVNRADGHWLATECVSAPSFETRMHRIIVRTK